MNLPSDVTTSVDVYEETEERLAGSKTWDDERYYASVLEMECERKEHAAARELYYGQAVAAERHLGRLLGSVVRWRIAHTDLHDGTTPTAAKWRSFRAAEDGLVEQSLAVFKSSRALCTKCSTSVAPGYLMCEACAEAGGNV